MDMQMIPNFICLFVLINAQLTVNQSKLSTLLSLTFALGWFLTNELLMILKRNS